MDSNTTRDRMIRFARRQILEILERAYGEAENWSFIRSRALKILGEKGLEKASVQDDNILQAIKVARRSLLDLLQASYGSTPQWDYVRSRVMSIFGRHGLEKLIILVENDDDDNASALSCWFTDSTHI